MGVDIARARRDIPLKPLDALINVAFPVIVLLTLSDPSRLGPLRALLLSISVPLAFGIWEVLRSRTLNISSVMGIIGVTLTGVIGVFDLDSSWYPVKEAIVPLGFAAILLLTDRTSFPVAKLLVDVLLRRDRVREGLKRNHTQAGFRAMLSGVAKRWAGILSISGVLKFLLSSWCISAPTNTPEFNRQIATYELVQLPTTFLLSGVLILLLIYWIGQRASELTGYAPREIYHGGEKLSRLFERVKGIAGRVRA